VGEAVSILTVEVCIGVEYLAILDIPGNEVIAREGSSGFNLIAFVQRELRGEALQLSKDLAFSLGDVVGSNTRHRERCDSKYLITEYQRRTGANRNTPDHFFRLMTTATTNADTTTAMGRSRN